MAMLRIANSETPDTELKFQVGPGDVLAYSRWTARNLPGARRYARFERWVILILALASVTWGIARGAELLRSLLLMVPAVFAAWAVPSLQARMRAQASSDQIIHAPGVLGQWEVALHERGLGVHGPVGEEMYAWNSIDRIERSGCALYVFLGEANAFIIPGNAFASDVAAAEFQSHIVDRLDSGGKSGGSQ